jgi:hypothetical protein
VKDFMLYGFMLLLPYGKSQPAGSSFAGHLTKNLKQYKTFGYPIFPVTQLIENLLNLSGPPNKGTKLSIIYFFTDLPVSEKQR